MEFKPTTFWAHNLTTMRQCMELDIFSTPYNSCDFQFKSHPERPVSVVLSPVYLSMAVVCWLHGVRWVVHIVRHSVHHIVHHCTPLYPLYNTVVDCNTANNYIQDNLKVTIDRSIIKGTLLMIVKVMDVCTMISSHPRDNVITTLTTMEQRNYNHGTT